MPYYLKRYVVVRVLMALAFSGAALGLPPSAAASDALSCTGPFARDSSHASLVKAFGKPNVTTANVPGVEGETLPATVIFPKDGARRIEVIWFDAAGKRRPSMIRVGEGFTGTVAGIGLGTTLTAVEAANGKPVTLYGFEWDMGGWVSDFKGGALAKLPGGCILQLRFAANETTSDAVRLKVSGDAQFSSASPAMRAAKPVVSELGIGWGE